MRYYFFSNEGQPPEPPHVHIKGGGRDAKIWLEPIVSIADNRDVILRAWHDHFGN
jgi:hypothetical protein